MSQSEDSDVTSNLKAIARILFLTWIGWLGWNSHAQESRAAVRVIPLGKSDKSANAESKGRAPASVAGHEAGAQEGAVIIRDVRLIPQTPALRNSPESTGTPLVPRK